MGVDSMKLHTFVRDDMPRVCCKCVYLMVILLAVFTWIHAMELPICEQYHAFNSDTVSCEPCSFCCEVIRDGHQTTLTAEEQCKTLVDGQYLYACFDSGDKHACPNPSYTFPPPDTTSNSSDCSAFSDNNNGTCDHITVTWIVCAAVVVVVVAVILGILRKYFNRGVIRRIREICSAIAPNARKNKDVLELLELKSDENCSSQGGAQPVRVPIEDTNEPGSPGTAPSHMDQNNPDTLLEDAEKSREKHDGDRIWM
ncbi:uncharacterized protein LOC106151682 isoform X2 [Lingula anatina]|uniref:Uncharacterized protein LOC106151682 isoform X2 n=1 Tax=Lingula anatina TaxID=7574 RepID=A0A1S3H3I0_LINAN|nr:uncharacterized protein LOC106151682 isoform X2 [Lingula anatina]|eukprot:XP_013380507.1 uncharacterized protein LOC106151682 isoform X2 [Lingula anatina]